MHFPWLPSPLLTCRGGSLRGRARDRGSSSSEVDHSKAADGYVYLAVLFDQTAILCPGGSHVVNVLLARRQRGRLVGSLGAPGRGHVTVKRNIRLRIRHTHLDG